MKYLSQFWLMITAGVGTGLIIGLSVSRLFKGIREEYTPLLLFAIALITYALAIGVGGSGMLAVAICGLVAGNFSISKKEEKEKIIRFEDQLSEMLRISVFTLLGAQVTLLMGMREFVIIILFFILRPIFLLSMMGGLKRKFSRLDIMLMSFIAPRGLPAAAMVPIIAAAAISVGQPAMAETIVNVVFMVILLSVLFSTIVAKIGSIERFQNAHRKHEEEKEPPKEEEHKKEDYSDLFHMLEEKEDTRG